MYVKNWMKTEVITSEPNDTFYKVAKIMKEKKIRHMPVVDKQKIVGMISDRDVRLASPSNATSLSKGEIGYLLEKITAAEIMNRQLFTIEPDATIEYASEVMKEHRIGSLPVVDDENRIVGIISTIDILEAFFDVMGGSAESYRLTIQTSDKIGVLAEITKIIADHEGFIISIVTPYYGTNRTRRQVVVRIQVSDIKDIIADLERHDKKVVTMHKCNLDGWQRT
ncbi:MAG: CBS domain-containing protein [bacterium]|nr:MAG: CBS domain-containing protein [bacterium]